MNRRTASLILGGSVAALMASAVDKENSKPDKAQAKKWMDDLFDQFRGEHGALLLGRFADPMYYVARPITWKPNPGQEKYKAVTVPEGFVTDLASIPRLFWQLFRPDGRYAYAAIVHDYLYWFQIRSRDESDMILKFGMQDFSVDPASVASIYAAVRLGGATAWSENSRLRKRGEKRLLKRFPSDPTTTWDQWKVAPDVFADA